MNEELQGFGAEGESEVHGTNVLAEPKGEEVVEDELQPMPKVGEFARERGMEAAEAIQILLPDFSIVAIQSIFEDEGEEFHGFFSLRAFVGHQDG